MVSQIEKLVRENDDSDLRISENARRISRKFDLNYGTCENYLMAKRKGFSSHTAYLEFLALRGGYSSLKEYKHLPTRQRRLEKREFEERFVRCGGCYDMENLAFSEVPLNDSLELDELKSLVRDLVEELPRRTREIIYSRFFSGRSQTDVARMFGTSRQNISGLEQRALEILRRKCLHRNLPSYFSAA